MMQAIMVVVKALVLVFLGLIVLALLARFTQPPKTPRFVPADVAVGSHVWHHLSDVQWINQADPQPGPDLGAAFDRLARACFYYGLEAGQIHALSKALERTPPPYDPAMMQICHFSKADWESHTR